MTTCRIYLCTYRRNALLPRALNSLLQQTFTDWVCELHNDDPQDPFPQQLVEQIQDPRIILVHHEQNWGAMRVFNHVFSPVEEEFVSLLEDDNWWEPDFLERMVETLRSHPAVNIAWANMRVWQEEADGSWRNLQQTIWNMPEAETVELFQFPDRRQIFGALHSQGAMLVRGTAASRYRIPDSTTSAAGEHVRERSFDYPILLVPQVLGNYALTRDTSRSNHWATWTTIQILLAGSFLKNVPMQDETLHQILQEGRSQPVRITNTLLWIALLYPECRHLLPYTAPGDWLYFLASLLKRPIAAYQVFQQVSRHQEVRSFLDQQTALRVKAAQTCGFSVL